MRKQKEYSVYKLSRKEKRIMKNYSKALRKYLIIKASYGFDDKYDSKVEHGKEIGKLNYGLRHFGYLRKGKIHCSCPWCRQKTGKDGYKISDIKKLDRLGYQD